jgi:hypothetical protein
MINSAKDIPNPSQPRKVLVTFGSDGTLVRFGGKSASHPLVFIRALDPLSDLRIRELSEALTGLVFSQFCTEVETEFAAICDTEFDLALPVDELLVLVLRFPNLIAAMGTGNFDGIARKKLELELAGIAHFFVWKVARFGGVKDRADVVRAALARCVSRGFSAVVVTTGKESARIPGVRQRLSRVHTRPSVPRGPQTVLYFDLPCIHNIQIKNPSFQTLILSLTSFSSHIFPPHRGIPHFALPDLHLIPRRDTSAY